MARKWPNVFLSTSAWLPGQLSDEFVAFMHSRTGSDKVLFGSNGLDWERYLAGFPELELREDTLEKVLRENPKRVFGLEGRLRGTEDEDTATRAAEPQPA